MRAEEEIVAKCGHRTRLISVLDHAMRKRDPVACYTICLSVWLMRNQKPEKCGECSGEGSLRRQEIDMDELADEVVKDFDRRSEK